MRQIPSFVLLRAFEAAARLQSFTLAAHELHLTPSAISHQIRELEAYFGTKLFERRSRHVEPTVKAQRLLESLGRVFDTIEAACRDVAQGHDTRMLAVHCAPSLAVKWLGPRLPAFMHAHPDITISLSSGAEPVDLSRARELDVFIGYGSVATRPGIVVQALGSERIVPMCSPSLLRGDEAARSSLLRLPLIDSKLSRVTWSDWFGRNGLTLPARPRLAFDRAALAIAAAADGMGVALESRRLAERELLDGALVEIGAEVFDRLESETHFVCFRSADGKAGNVRLFVDWLLRQAGVSQAPP